MQQRLLVEWRQLDHSIVVTAISQWRRRLSACQGLQWTVWAHSVVFPWFSVLSVWLDLQPVDIKSRWRHNWKSAQVINSHLVCDPTIRQSGFDLPRQQWSLLNRFRTEHGHCDACRRKWRLTDTDPCGKTQTMSCIVESCPLTKLNGGLSRLHSADEDAVSWLTSYGS